MRKFLGILFLLIVIFALAGTWMIYRTLSPAISIETETSLELVIDKPIAEAPDQTPDLLARLKTPTFRKTIAAIGRAAADERITSILFKIHGPYLSFAQIEELHEAIDGFHAAGKETAAVIFAPGTGTMYLASHCTYRMILPCADIFMDGLHAEIAFYKGGLDKLGIRVEAEQMKEYKSAAEPFTRESLSDPAREDIEALLDGLFDRMKTGMSNGTGVPAATLEAMMARSPITPQEALSEGLVTHIGYPEDILAELFGGWASGENILDFNEYTQKTMKERGKNRIAVLSVNGMIMMGSSGRDMMMGRVAGDETILAELDAIEEDERVRALVLRVDSPGGSLYASDRIWHRLGQISDSMPVVVSMGSVAASGGYYISMNADVIVADKTTITGSIGVVSMKFNLAGLYEKLGISHETIDRGGTDMFTSGRGLTPDERERFREFNERAYDIFVTKAAAGRGRTVDELEPLARGRTWTGSDAHAVGLVDTLGGIRLALDIARDLSGIEPGVPAAVVEYPRPKEFGEFIEDLDLPFLEGASSGPLSVIENRILDRFTRAPLTLWPYRVGFEGGGL